MKKHRDEKDNSQDEPRTETDPRNGSGSTENQNPPRTTSNGWLTTPKFGSSTSGGGEIEPGPERD
jgi:hypothetical protein